MLVSPGAALGAFPGTVRAVPPNSTVMIRRMVQESYEVREAPHPPGSEHIDIETLAAVAEGRADEAVAEWVAGHLAECRSSMSATPMQSASAPSGWPRLRR